MHRYLPLLLLFVACSSDPLALHEVTVSQAVVSDGLSEVIFENDGPIKGVKELLPAHEDLNLKLSFRADAGAKADLMVQGKYTIELPSLAVAGAEPRIAPATSPGVWQDLEIVFISAKDDKPAIFPAVYLNGTLVYYQTPLEAVAGASTGPLTLNVKSGNVELTDLRQSDQGGKGSVINADGKVELNMPLMEYELYELPTGTVEVTNWGQLTPKKTGYINRFDLHAIRETGSMYAIRFFGTLDIPQAGEYSFTSSSPASTQVYVDGQKIIDQSGRHPFIHTEGFIELSKGPHEVRVDYFQNGGWHKFDLAYKTPDGNSGFLNTMEEKKTIATAGATNPQVLETDDYPYLLRSFLYFPSPKVYDIATKRTHVISVGEADGPHYSLDLQNGALLQAWRGGFADTYEMWVGRGEPQVMRPLGPIIPFDGTPQWADIKGDDDPWPMELAASDDFSHSQHSLDEAGRPTFIYTMGQHSLGDKLTPTETGLIRELTHNVGGNGTIFTKVASARQIEETAPGEYQLRGPGLKLTIQSYDGNRLVLQHANGNDRLLAELPAKGHLTYLMEW
ncbi:PA14 domain-containing protein [Neolewinella persica]|uniref:PA14 domain-containing protein n=1 Tax=Neolewinella persica TaxID=70998 RepID=UPI00039B6EF0|nr:PA14 domain-containing protein [Neolewinella persica]